MTSLLKKARLVTSSTNSRYEADVVSIYYDEEDGVECLFYDCTEAALHPDAAPTARGTPSTRERLTPFLVSRTDDSNCSIPTPLAAYATNT